MRAIYHVKRFLLKEECLEGNLSLDSSPELDALPPPPEDGEGTHMGETHRVPRGHLGAFHFCPRIKVKNPWRGGLFP